MYFIIFFQKKKNTFRELTIHPDIIGYRIHFGMGTFILFVASL